MLDARIASARTRLVIQLSVGALVLIAAAWLFGAIAEDVVTGDLLTLLDERVAHSLHPRASASIAWVALCVSAITAISRETGTAPLAPDMRPGAPRRSLQP